MIIWNINKWFDKQLIKYNEEQLKELLAWSLRRRKYLLRNQLRKRVKTTLKQRENK